MKKLEDTALRISRRKAAKLHMERHREKVLAQRREWYARNRGKVRASQAAYNLLNKEKLRIARAASYQRNKKIIDARNEKWRKANQDKINALARARYKENREPFVSRTKKYDLAHPHNRKEQNIRYRLEHGDKLATNIARRRAIKKHAAPKWANRFFISEAYHLAALRTKMLGFKWHVDHIVPLQSKRVCGLHVENNLQVIPARTNHLKSNRSWPNMP